MRYFKEKLSTITICVGLVVNPVACRSPDDDTTPAAETNDEVGLTADELRRDGDFALNDLAILFPFPGNEVEIDTLLAPSSSGRRGVLLPRDVFAALPPLLSGDVPQVDAYSALRVMSVRFDPCHTGFDASHGAPCTPQIRLQLQMPALFPVEQAGVQAKEPVASLHLVYAVTEREFRTIARDLRKARRDSGMSLAGRPIGVHPIIERQGLRGRYAHAIKKLILRYAGKTSLERVAFEAVVVGPTSSGAAFEAHFGQLERRGTGFLATPIPTGDGIATIQVQSFVPTVLDDGLQAFNVTRTPEGRSTDAEAMALIFDPRALFAATPERLEIAARATFAVDNPRSHGLRTMDCVTCHSATSTRAVFSAFFSFDPNTQDPSRYTSTHNLSLLRDVTLEDDSNVMFGYHARLPNGGARLSLMQRLVNETAESVDYLNAHF